MKLSDYLKTTNKREITERLLKLDASIMALHENGYYVVSIDPNNMELYGDEITLQSFKDKIDRIDSGFNPDGKFKNILELGAIGVCAYNNLKTFYINSAFLKYLMENFDMFKKEIPEEIRPYYENIFSGNLEYMNSYIFQKNNPSANDRQSSRAAATKTKSTAIGRSFAEKERAFINVLLIPSMIVLGYAIMLLGIALKLKP